MLHLVDHFQLLDSQWDDDGSDIYFNSGNVGIGTNNPTTDLDVDGNIKCHGTLTFDHTNSTVLGINSWSLALNDNHRIYNRGNGNNGSDGFPEGLIFGNSYNGDHIKFDWNGNVGIGTMNPELDVIGTASINIGCIRSHNTSWKNIND